MQVMGFSGAFVSLHLYSDMSQPRETIAEKELVESPIVEKPLAENPIKAELVIGKPTAEKPTPKKEALHSEWGQ